jgi:hypothetical protein
MDLPQPTALHTIIAAVNSQLCGCLSGELLGAAAFDRLLTATLQAVAGFSTLSAPECRMPLRESCTNYEPGALSSSLQNELAGKQQQQGKEGKEGEHGEGLQVLLQAAGMAGQEWQRVAAAVLRLRGLGWGWWQIVEEVVEA